MKFTENTTFTWRNYNKRMPVRWELWQTGLTGLFSGLIPIVGQIRSFSDNTKHDLGLVYLPLAVLVITVLGVFIAKKQ